MKYNELSELCKLKGVKIKDVLVKVDYSRPGLESALNNETIDLRRLKLLCDYMQISPASFFDAGTFGVTIHAGGNVQSGNNNRMVLESKEREIEMLKQQIDQLKEQLKDKEEIIRLLKEKREG